MAEVDKVVLLKLGEMELFILEEVEAVLRNASFPLNEELKLQWSIYCRQDERMERLFTWLNNVGNAVDSVVTSLTVLQGEMGRVVVKAEEGDDL